MPSERGLSRHASSASRWYPFDRFRDEGHSVKRVFADLASARLDVTIDANVIAGAKGRCCGQCLIARDTENPDHERRSTRPVERRSDGERQFIWRRGPHAAERTGERKREHVGLPQPACGGGTRPPFFAREHRGVMILAAASADL